MPFSKMSTLFREVRFAVAPALHRRVRRRMEAEGLGWAQLLERLLTSWLETTPSPPSPGPR